MTEEIKAMGSIFWCPKCKAWTRHTKKDICTHQKKYIAFRGRVV